MSEKFFRIALAGNPNCGKTTMFNALTGNRQHVGNYAGVTVERKIGYFRIADVDFELIDLPGIYSLSNSSPEEKVAFQELLRSDIDLVLDVIDAGNAQRNLYLTTQLTELGIPMLLDFNMIDDARQKGLHFNFEMLSGFFGAPIVQTAASVGLGMNELREKLLELARAEALPHPVTPKYGPRTDEAIRSLTAEVEKLKLPEFATLPARYLAIKILEQDPDLCARSEFAHLLEPAANWRDRIAQRNGINSKTLMADVRYGVISGACREALSFSNERRRQISDVIDEYVTSRFLGLPIFLGLMYLMFVCVFTLAQYPTEWLGNFFALIGDTVNRLWPEGQLELLRQLLVEGVIGGVGGVLTFVPNILLLFLAIAFLEGTGYMARAAFIMDGFMHKFGLHGKSFIPMLLGFGCSVPAVLATRTIDNERDRLTTIFVVPFISCGARLPIYAMMIPAFFAERYQALVLWLLYLIGVIIALVCARLLRSTLFKGDGDVFVMELPPYRMPTWQSIFILMWEKTVLYLHKAGTTILAASVILFIINTFPRLEKPQSLPPAAAAVTSATPAAQRAAKAVRAQEEAVREAKYRAAAFEYSIAGRIGKKLAVVFSPIGFDWRVSSALIGAFAAKELFVAQLGILFAAEEIPAAEPGGESDASLALTRALRRTYTPLQAFSIMLFCLLTVPCIATVMVVKKEAGSWHFTLAQIAAYFIVAYVLAFLVYQGGLLLNIGTRLLL